MTIQNIGHPVRPNDSSLRPRAQPPPSAASWNSDVLQSRAEKSTALTRSATTQHVRSPRRRGAALRPQLASPADMSVTAGSGRRADQQPGRVREAGGETRGGLAQ